MTKLQDKIPLRWAGAIFDTSGYASATRSYIGALMDSNEIDLTLTAVSFEQQRTTHGRMQDRCKKFLDRKGVPYKINVVHLTPENYPGLMEKDKYNIAYSTWETDKLPKGWAELYNQMDEIWVPSQWNKTVFQNCGVYKPIHVVHHGIKVDTTPSTTPLAMGISNETFLFYSIFQWIERKNPLGLLKAYLTEFKPEEDVCLALKTYRLNTSEKEKQIIKNDINNVKRGLNLKEYPQVRFFGDLLSSEHMKAFHMRGNCFILAHRAEGFGIPHAEAMAYGKPVIATEYGGNLEFMNEKNSYLANCQTTPVCNMIFPNYDGSMTWADPDLMHIRKLMREVYTNREQSAAIGLVAKEHIETHFSWPKISKQIIDRLREIQKEL